ncbi:MAG: damage-inducible protein DinB [Hyphomonadaceae bacterium]|nr:damage-inducible protein DinB [Hyphomonadaceae bacterium]
MISPTHVQTMARYNAWQNGSLYRAASSLPAEALTEDRGAFFGSMLRTFNHLLWADGMWMSRFTPRVTKPEQAMHGALDRFDSLAALKPARDVMDENIRQWAGEVSQEWLDSDLEWYSGAAQRDMVSPVWFCVTHFFNHQTHHRGQIHAMLTAAGAKPEDTDLFLMDENA